MSLRASSPNKKQRLCRMSPSLLPFAEFVAATFQVQTQQTACGPGSIFIAYKFVSFFLLDGANRSQDRRSSS